MHLFLRKKNFIAALILCLSTIVILLSGCELDPDGDDFVDDHELNPGLLGTWAMPGGLMDIYIIEQTETQKTISHPGSADVPLSGYADAPIEYVYNFSDTAGCLIIKRKEDDNRYTAVFYKNLKANSVLLGESYDVTIEYPNNNNPSVVTLEEATEKFKPVNAERWGGGSAQAGTPQVRQ